MAGSYLPQEARFGRVALSFCVVVCCFTGFISPCLVGVDIVLCYCD